ncbi:MAG: head GIN domain-containing protein [Sphingomicrobium sp.]
MAKAFAIAGAVAAGVLAAACSHAGAQDPGPDASRNYQVGAFQKIEVSGPFEVQVRTGSASSVSARGPQNMLDRMVVEVRGDTLLIHPREEKRGFHWGWGRHDTINVAVTTPALRGAQIAGSGGIRVDQVKGDRFEGGISGSGDLSIALLEVQSVNLGVGGSGSMKAERGRAGMMALNIEGSGDIDTSGVAAQSASASIAGSGNISARATGTAAVNIMGSGDVEISGGARCTISKAGSGNVRCS